MAFSFENCLRIDHLNQGQVYLLPLSHLQNLSLCPLLPHHHLHNLLSGGKKQRWVGILRTQWLVLFLTTRRLLLSAQSLNY